MSQCHICKTEDAKWRCPECGRLICPTCTVAGICSECRLKSVETGSTPTPPTDIAPSSIPEASTPSVQQAGPDFGTVFRTTIYVFIALAIIGVIIACVVDGCAAWKDKPQINGGMMNGLSHLQARRSSN